MSSTAATMDQQQQSSQRMKLGQQQSKHKEGFAQRCNSCWSATKCRFQQCMAPLAKRKVWLLEITEDIFESFGHYVYDHPIIFITIPTIICLIFSLGFLRRVPELDMEKLYSLPVSQTVTAKNELNRVFPIERIQYIFVSSENEHELLSESHLKNLDQFWKKVTQLKVPRALAQEASIPGAITVMADWLKENDPEMLHFEDDYVNKEGRDAMTSAERSAEDRDEFIRLEDVCIYDSDKKCKMVNPLELYSNPSQYDKPLRTTRYPTIINFKTSKAYRIDSMFGGIVKETRGTATMVYNATAAAFRLDLNGTPEKVVESSAYEQALIAVIENINLPGLKLHMRADRSLSDELAQSCQLKGEDLFMLVCSAFFVFVFSVTMNSSCDRYRTKWLPAAVGVISTLLAYGGGVGLCHLCGLKHVPPSESTPFILLGIGVDDIFVISNAYSLTYLHSHDARTRLGLSFRDAGISITLTTVTNILAFAVGATSAYYSIRIFCIVTAVGLLAGYILALTLFAGVLSINASLEQKYRSVPLWESDVSTATVAVRSSDGNNDNDFKSNHHPLRNDEVNDHQLQQLCNKDNDDALHLSDSTRTTSSDSSMMMLADPTPKASVHNHVHDDDASLICTSEPPSTASSSKLLEDRDHEDDIRSSTSSSDRENVPSTRSHTLAHSASSDSMSSEPQPHAPESSSPSSFQCHHNQASPAPVATPRISLDRDVSDLEHQEAVRPDTGSTTKSYSRSNSAKRSAKSSSSTRSVPEDRTPWPQGLPCGYFAVEELDGHLVVAERVAEMCEKNKKRKAAKKQKKQQARQACQSSSFTVQRPTNETPANSTADSNGEQNAPITSSSLEFIWLEDDDVHSGDGIEMTPHHSNLFSNNTGNLQIQSFNNNFNNNDDDQIPSSDPSLSPSEQSTSPIRKFDLNSIPRLIQVKKELIPVESINFQEPYGTVGKGPRYFFMHYYGPFLMQPIVKAIVLLGFLALLIFTCYNATTVEAGLKVRDITPFGSYLREFYDVREKYFSAYGDECVVFFPDGGRWWDEDVQNGILNLTQSVRQSDHVVFVLNGFEDLLTFINTKKEEQARDRVALGNSTTTPNDNNQQPQDDQLKQQEFMTSLSEFLVTPRGMMYATMFTIEGGSLTSWKFYYWMQFQDNTLKAMHWFQEIQNLLKDGSKAGIFEGYVFTPLAVMWESDPVILHSTLGNMAVALLSMGICASLLIPDFKSGLLVLLVIIMIDLDVYAFMPVWNLNLNMLTMVNLVLSIGFAVDYTAHITHCFNHCKGKTRDRRVIETLLLMGLPVTEGMISTYAAVGVLSFSTKYALVVVFRMVTLVMAFAFTHGVILMPVILSLVGPMDPREVDIIEIQEGKIVASWTVDGSTGEVLDHLLHYSHHVDERRDMLLCNDVNVVDTTCHKTAQSS